jgi:acyl carrier protein
LGPSFHFPDDLGPDSLDAVEIVMACEEAFDDEIPHEEMRRNGKFRKRQELINLRKHKKGGDSN